MNATWQTAPKIDIARRLLTELLDSLKKIDNIELALRCFGHTKFYPPPDCDDTRLEVPFGKHVEELITGRLKNITARGTTPIALSMEACAADFPNMEARNIVILITDGIEECGGDPCAVSAALQAKGIIIRPFVIGLGLDDSLIKSFECVGKFYDATNEETFKTILKIVISQVLNNTSCQVNLLDKFGNPTETNVNMTFYDRVSHRQKYNFVHTMNAKGNPDTLRIDALPTYKIVVHTIPPVEKDSIVLTPGKHTIIGIDAPQGYLTMNFQAVSDYTSLKCIVRKAGETKTLNVQDFNSTEKYLIGKYDLEVLSLPRINIYNAEVSQSHTTTVKVPQPGLVTFNSLGSGYGSLYSEEKDSLKLIYNLDNTATKQTLIMMPGNYKAVYRARNARESLYTTEKRFVVVSGGSIIIALN